MALSSRLFRWLSWLNRPLFGTKVIPAQASVPADLFPEDEFPVFCPKCDYLLRGLRDSRCPECGSPFDRGRLLVDQYARERAHRLEHGRLGCWALRLSLIVLAFLLLYIAGTHVLFYWPNWFTWIMPRPTLRQVEYWTGRWVMLRQAAWWGQFVAFCVLMALLATVLFAARRNARKRQRVLDAMEAGPESRVPTNGRRPSAGTQRTAQINSPDR